MRGSPMHGAPCLLLSGAFNWAIWCLCSGVICSQFIGLFRKSTTAFTHITFGRSPLEPMMPLQGFNDEPYSDRAYVCIREANVYVPKQLSKVLTDPMLSVVVSNSSAVDGFRVVKRATVELSPQIHDSYARVCDRVAFILPAIQDSCAALGFNVTREGLRIVDGIVGDSPLLNIPRALPVLIVPYWDNTLHSYSVMPATDGTACVFSLNGVYQSSSLTYGVLRGVPRSVRVRKAEEWMQMPRGKWRHGWLDDMQGEPWMVNMMTSSNGSSLGIRVRQFDTLANKELNCTASAATSQCKSAIVIDTWGKTFTSTSEITQQDQVFISNGKRFGFFLFDALTRRTVTISYSLETFVSNVSIFLLLFRWLVTLVAMHKSYRRGLSGWQTAGLGCLSSARTFNILPIVMLPQLKMLLTIFSTTGCFFEGQQSALSNAWFVMYPGIIELLFYYYSLLNIIGKVTYRRVSDALFGPTLVFLCALHYFRRQLAEIQWLRLNGRISTVLLSDEVDALTLADFFTSDVALRLGGNVRSLFIVKLAALALSLLPLLFAENMTTKGKKSREYPPCEIENALALRASNVGGLGRSSVYAMTPVRLEESPRLSHASIVRLVSAPRVSNVFQKRNTIQPAENDVKEYQNQPVELPRRAPTHVLLSYELDRLGYLVFGGKFLISYEDWYVISSIAPLRVVERLWNYRVSVFTVTKSEGGLYYRTSPLPRMCRVDDPQLRAIPFYDVTVCTFA